MRLIEYTFLTFEEKDKDVYIVSNKKKEVLGEVSFSERFGKFSMKYLDNAEFEELCTEDLAAFLSRLNKQQDLEQQIKLVPAVGRPKSGGLKHGFYSNKFRPCDSCPKKKDGSCPYYHIIPGLQHMHKHTYDEFGVNRCTIEYDYFQYLKKTFMESYDLKKEDVPIVEKMCMILVRSGRVEEYLADKGLTHKRFLKDEKTGRVFESEAQNILKKDAYFDDKMLREWLDNLKMSRKSRQLTNDDDDLAIIFTKSIQVKGAKGKKPEQVKEAVREVQAQIEDISNSNI